MSDSKLGIIIAYTAKHMKVFFYIKYTMFNKMTASVSGHVPFCSHYSFKGKLSNKTCDD